MGSRRAIGPVAWIGTGIVFSALAAYLAARLATHEHSHGTDTATTARSRDADLHAWMHEQLDIGDDQWAKLEPFERAFETERSRLVDEIDAGGVSLAAAIRGGDRNDPAITQALQRINRAQAELQEKTLDHFFVMKEHLDPAQADRLIEWTHDSIIRQHHR